MFFKKKKLIEIDGKMDSVLEQLDNCNHGQEDILVAINRIEHKLDLLEERISEDFITRTQSVMDEIHHVKRDFLESQEKSTVTLGKSISDDGTISREKIEKLTRELDKRIEFMDSSLRLLLLNSVMDQIEV